MKTFLLVMFLTLLPVLAYGTTYYVATTGSDSNSCAQAQSQATPKLTINAGLGCLVAGDTLIVKSGVYPEAFGVNTGGDTLLGNWPSGVPGSPITVKSEIKGGAIIRPNNLGSWWYMLRTKNAHDLIIDGFVFDGINQSYAGEHVYLDSGSHDITIQNCELKNALDLARFGQDVSFGMSMEQSSTYNLRFTNNKIHDIGIGAVPGQPFYSYGFYWHGRDSIFENNEVYNCSGFAIHFYTVYPGMNNNIFRNNSLHDNGLSGLLLSGGQNTQAYNNLIYNNGWRGGAGGINVGQFGGQSAANNNIYNNTIFQNAEPCIVMASTSSGSVVRNNICYNNASDTVEVQGGATVTVDHNLLGMNPFFANAAARDFHLQANSPAIDTGVNVGLSYNGSAPDLGVLESGASVPLPRNLVRIGIGN
jgi:parallel beta-helix repeat protein